MSCEPKALERVGDGKRHTNRLAQAVLPSVTAAWTALLAGIGSLSMTLLVTVPIYLVHGVSRDAAALAGEKGPAAARPAPKERAYYGALPQNVAEMRDQILAAVHAGDVAELRGAIEWNEITPDFGAEAKGDPVKYWKRVSGDGDGREVLAILANILALAPARLAIGKDPENTFVYVWPYLAELPLNSLSAAEQVDLLRLMPPAEAARLRRSNKWSWWRVAIGADGTWHTFRKYD